MRTALIVAALALATSAAADPQLTPEVVAGRTECAKLGAAWIKQHPLRASGEYMFSARFFYGSTTNQCWIVKSENYGSHRDRHLIDAQTGAETMNCRDHPFDSNDHGNPKRDCDYIEKVEDATLASGFMAVPFPSEHKDIASPKK
jgi:hypothetical protein